MAVLVFRCAQCGKKLKGSDEAVGKKIKCRYCNHTFRAKPITAATDVLATVKTNHGPQKPTQSATAVLTKKKRRKTADADDMVSHVSDPSTSALEKKAKQEAVKAERADSIQKMLDSFAGSIESFEPSVNSRSKGGLAVAVAIVSIGFIFATLLGLVGAHAFFNLSWVTDRNADPMWMVLYIVPILFGLILVLFLLKTLLSKPDEPHHRIVARSNEPVFTSFINLLAKHLGCKPPARIEVDFTASASVRPLTSLFNTSTDRYVLRLGLPLVAGLTQQNLVATLAIELATMSIFNRSPAALMAFRCTRWLSRATSGIDSTDAYYLQMIRQSGIRKLLVVFRPGYQFFSLLSRQTYKVPHALCRFFAARSLATYFRSCDELTVQLVGTDCFSTALLEHRYCRESLDMAVRDLADSIDSNYAVNDAFESMTVKRKNITPNRLATIRNDEASWGSFQQSFFASLDQRIELATTNPPSSPIFENLLPSRNLFRHYSSLTQQCTADLKRGLKATLLASSRNGKTTKGRKRVVAKTVNDYITKVVGTRMKNRR